jgi:hypothetical protein
MLIKIFLPPENETRNFFHSSSEKTVGPGGERGYLKITNRA